MTIENLRSLSIHPPSPLAIPDLPAEIVYEIAKKLLPSGESYEFTHRNNLMMRMRSFGINEPQRDPFVVFLCSSKLNRAVSAEALKRWINETNVNIEDPAFKYFKFRDRGEVLDFYETNKLHSIHLKNCSFKDFEDLRVRFPNLKRLSLELSGDAIDYTLFFSFPALEALDINVSYVNVKLDLSQLTQLRQLKVSCPCVDDLVLPSSLPFINKIHLNIMETKIKDLSFQVMPNLKNLKISIDSVESLDLSANTQLTRIVLMMFNLQQVKLPAEMPLLREVELSGCDSLKNLDLPAKLPQHFERCRIETLSDSKTVVPAAYLKFPLPTRVSKYKNLGK